MNRTGNVTTTVQKLQRHFLFSLLLTGLLLLLVLFQLLPFWRESQPIHITLERYLIVVTLITIPLILRWFSKRLRNSNPPLAWEEARRCYQQAFLWRHYILTLVTLLHVVLFGISRNMNFFWFAVVLFIVFLFCRPSQQELESLLTEPVDSADVEQENQDNESDDTAAGK